jgi:hypothetical protein
VGHASDTSVRVQLAGNGKRERQRHFSPNPNR